MGVAVVEELQLQIEVTDCDLKAQLGPHIGGLWRDWHVGDLDRAMYGEAIWPRHREFQLGEVVAICGHLGLFVGRDPDIKLDGRRS